MFSGLESKDQTAKTHRYGINYPNYLDKEGQHIELPVPPADALDTIGKVRRSPLYVVPVADHARVPNDKAAVVVAPRLIEGPPCNCSTSRGNGNPK